MLELRRTQSSVVRSAAYPHSGPSGAVRCSHFAWMWRNGGTIHGTETGVSSHGEQLGFKWLDAFNLSLDDTNIYTYPRSFATYFELGCKARFWRYCQQSIRTDPPFPFWPQKLPILEVRRGFLRESFRMWEYSLTAVWHPSHVRAEIRCVVSRSRITLLTPTVDAF